MLILSAEVEGNRNENWHPTPAISIPSQHAKNFQASIYFPHTTSTAQHAHNLFSEKHDVVENYNWKRKLINQLSYKQQEF